MDEFTIGAAVMVALQEGRISLKQAVDIMVSSNAFETLAQILDKDSESTKEENGLRVSIKPECNRCGYFNPVIKTFYKCHVPGTCPGIILAAEDKY